MTHALRSSFVARALVALAACCALSCHDLDDFNTKSGDAYCGSVGLTVLQDGFVGRNAMPDLELSLTLNTGKLSSEPGFLRSSDASNGFCAPRPLFQDSPLRAIPEVDHDVLSALSFGEGHEHDFFVWVDSTCQGTMLGVVSLMKNRQVELRLFKPARLPDPDAPPEARPGFAVFHMDLTKSDPEHPNMPCGF